MLENLICPKADSISVSVSVVPLQRGLGRLRSPVRYLRVEIGRVRQPIPPESRSEIQSLNRRSKISTRVALGDTDSGTVLRISSLT
jgi:hypothetical protein